MKNYSIAYELTDGGVGWFLFHLHHLHLSLLGVAGKPGGGVKTRGGQQCLVPDCTPVSALDGTPASYGD